MSPKKKHIKRCGEVIATPIAERREGAGPSTGQFIQSPDVADVDEHAGRLPATRGVLATSRSIWSGTCRGEPTRLGPTPRLRATLPASLKRDFEPEAQAMQRALDELEG